MFPLSRLSSENLEEEKRRIICTTKQKQWLSVLKIIYSEFLFSIDSRENFELIGSLSLAPALYHRPNPTSLKFFPGNIILEPNIVPLPARIELLKCAAVPACILVVSSYDESLHVLPYLPLWLTFVLY